MGAPGPGYYFRGTSILPATPSGEKSLSSLIYTGKCLLTGIKIVTNGTNDATVEIYDNTEASGTKVDKFVVSGDENYGGAIYGKSPIMMSTGIYVTLSGTGANFFVFYFMGRIDSVNNDWGTW